MINAERLMFLGGVTAFLMTVYWVRNRTLREKYAVMWLAVSTGLLLAGLVPRPIMESARAAQLSYPAAVLFVSLAAIYVFSMSVSISLTRQRRVAIRLEQELALLRHRLERIEGDRTDAPRRESGSTAAG